MGTTLRRVTMLVTALAVLLVPSTAFAVTDADRTEAAIGYLDSQQRANGAIPAFSPIGSTSDAVVAIVAAGTGRRTLRKALGYLRRQVVKGNVTAVGLRAKVVIAVAAAGRDPRAFGGENLVRELRTTITDAGRFGTAAVFDQALATLALKSAGVQPGFAVTDWLLGAQCPDGGWAYDEPYASGTDDESCWDGSETDYFASESNATSYAIQALEATGRNGYATDPFSYLDTVRDPDKGGWAYSAAWLATDANSTALVLQAYAAAGLPVPAGGRAALRRLQYPRCGAWAYSWSGDARSGADVGATIGAIPGLLGAALPVTGPVTGNAGRTPPCA